MHLTVDFRRPFHAQLRTHCQETEWHNCFTEKLRINAHFIFCSHSLKSSCDQPPSYHWRPPLAHLAPVSTCLHSHSHKEALGLLLPLGTATLIPCRSPGESCQTVTHKPLYSPLLFLSEVKSLSCAWLFATLWTGAYQAPLSIGFSRQECWSGLQFPSPGDLPHPGIEPRSPALQADSLTSCRFLVPPLFYLFQPILVFWFVWCSKPWFSLPLTQDSRRLYCPWLDLRQNSPRISLSSVQSLSHVQLFVTPSTEAQQASLSITNTRSLLKLMSIESEMPSNHPVLCRPLLLLPSIFPSIRVFSNESVLPIR